MVIIFCSNKQINNKKIKNVSGILDRNVGEVS